MRKPILYSVALLLTAVLSFRSSGEKTFEFAYPKKAGTTFTLTSDRFNKFSKEWRGSDYYYYAEKDGFICSVLYYKLNNDEKLELVDAPKAATGGPDISPAYPYAYFKNYSNLKAMEKNDESWGEPTEDFMFRQNNVVMQGMQFAQKNMYGYAMVDKDLFVNIHLSKMAASSADSTEMRAILKSLTLKKEVKK